MFALALNEIFDLTVAAGRMACLTIYGAKTHSAPRERWILSQDDCATRMIVVHDDYYFKLCLSPNYAFPAIEKYVINTCKVTIICEIGKEKQFFLMLTEAFCLTIIQIQGR